MTAHCQSRTANNFFSSFLPHTVRKNVAGKKKTSASDVFSPSLRWSGVIAVPYFIKKICIETNLGNNPFLSKSKQVWVLSFLLFFFLGVTRPQHGDHKAKRQEGQQKKVLFKTFFVARAKPSIRTGPTFTAAWGVDTSNLWCSFVDVRGVNAFSTECMA
jgi:hypothetical protein